MSRRHHKEDNFDRVAEIARSAYRTASEIKDLVNVEPKQFTVAQTSTSTTSSGTIVVIQAMSQGATSITRVGDSIKNQNLTLRWTGELATTINSARIRMIVFWDESNVITGPSQLLAYAGNAGQVSLSGKTYDNRYLTRILYDKTMTLNKAVSGGTGFFPIREKVIKLDKHTQFDTGTTTIVTGACKICFLSDRGLGNEVFVSFNALLSYTDD